MSRYVLASMSDSQIKNISGGEVKHYKKYHIQDKSFTPYVGGLYSSEIFGAYKKCQCGRQRLPGKCPVCGIRVLTEEEDIFGYYTVCVPYVSDISFGYFQKLYRSIFNMYLSDDIDIWNYKFEVDSINNGTGTEVVVSKNGENFIVKISTFDKSDEKKDLEKFGYFGLLNLLNNYKFNTSDAEKLRLAINTVVPISPIKYRLASVSPAGNLQIPEQSQRYSQLIYIDGAVRRYIERETNLSSIITVLTTINRTIDLIYSKESIVATSKESVVRYLTTARLTKSGRANVVGVSDIKMDEILLPRAIAYEAIKGDIIEKLKELEYKKSLEDDEYIQNNAYYMYSQLHPEAIKVFEAIIYGNEDYNETGSVAILNRAPTLHKLSMMAFYIKLWDEPAIGVHINVVEPFNMDFDGDQAGVYIINKDPYKTNIMSKLSPRYNWFYDKNKKPVFVPKNSMLLGLYHASKIVRTDEPRKYMSFDELEYDYMEKKISYNESINFENRITSYGREKLSNILTIPIDEVIGDNVITSKNIGDIVSLIGAKPNNIEILSELLNFSREIVTKEGNSYVTLGDIYKWDTKFPEIKEILSSKMTDHEKYIRLEELIPKLITNRINELAGTTYAESVKAGSTIKSQSLIEMFKPQIYFDGKEITVVDQNLINGLEEPALFMHTIFNREILGQKANLVPISGYFTRQIVGLFKDLIYRSDRNSPADQVGALLPEWAAKGRTDLNGNLVTGNSNKLIRVKSCISNDKLIINNDEIDYNGYKFPNYFTIGINIGTATSEDLTQKQLALKHGGAVWHPSSDKLIAEDDAVVENIHSNYITVRINDQLRSYPCSDEVLISYDATQGFVKKGDAIYYSKKILYVDQKLAEIKLFLGLAASDMKTTLKGENCYALDEGIVKIDPYGEELYINNVKYPIYKDQVYYVYDGMKVSIGDRICSGTLNVDWVLNSNLDKGYKVYVIYKAFTELLTGKFTASSLVFPPEFIEFFIKQVTAVGASGINSGIIHNPRILSKIEDREAYGTLSKHVGEVIEDDLNLRMIMMQGDLTGYGE